MKKPDVPANEAYRLRTLYALNMLDTPAEERFDRLTRLTQRMFNAPIAVVTLIAEQRIWFKSCIGLDASETHRDISFCGHTIAGNDILIVEDASKDERFIDNPVVTAEPGIRFYAGCPIRAGNGQNLGTLCVLDYRPREFTEEDIEALQDLTAMVESELRAIQLATMDELTGLSNRRGFIQLAGHLLKIARRRQEPATLAYLDLRDFKLINDNFGHAEGDLALQAFAGLICENFRDSDLLGRIGGDEFVVFLMGSGLKDARPVIDRFNQALTTYNNQAQKDYRLDYSCGLTEYAPSQHADLEALLADGDARMYEHRSQS